MAFKLSIIQHNVLSWHKHKTNLTNIYNEIDPDLLLINSYGVKNDEKIKIFNYTVYQSNKLDERNNGCAIAIKRNIKHRIREK